MIPEKIKKEIISLRQQGKSLPEISSFLGISKGSVFKYIRDVPILEKYKNEWFGKRGGSKRRMHKLIDEAKQIADNEISSLNKKEKLLVLTSLYWAEGSKKDLNFMNSDPNMVLTFVNLIRELFRDQNPEIVASIRLYPGMDEAVVKKYWSNLLSIPTSSFRNAEFSKGTKKEKLKYGMCRLRVLKGGRLLKLLTALRGNIASLTS